MTTRTAPLGFAAGLAGAPLLYAVVRVISMILHPEPDPAAIIWAEHSPTVTHFVVWLYASVVLLGGMLSLANAAPRAMPRVIGSLAVVSTFAMLIQSVWAP